MLGGNRISQGVRAAMAGAVLAFVPILVLCSCARSTPTPAPAVITFACLDERLSYYEALAQTFKAAHPDMAIRLIPKRPAALAAIGPADADVFTVSLPLEPFLKRGALLSLNNWLAAGNPPLKDDLYPFAYDAFTRNGQTWAMPIGVDPVLMFYNKGLFDERNTPYPKSDWTWDDFMHTGQQLRDAQQGIYGYAAGLWREEPWLFILQHGGHLVDDWQHPTRVTFDDPQTMEAMQWYHDMIFSLDVAPSQQEARRAFGTQQGVYGGVVAGKIGMWPGRFSSRILAASAVKVSYGTTVLPRDRQAVTLADVEAVAISPKTQRLQQAWEWVSFLSQQVPGQLAPARRSVAGSQAFEHQVGADVAAAVRASLEHAVVVPHEPAELYGKLNSAWAGAFDDILTGRWWPDEALRQAQERAK